MLESFLEMKEAIIEFVDRSSHQLNDLILSEKEWEVVEGLISVLQVLLKEATLFFSMNGANLSSVIPAMDGINKVFASGILNEETLSQPIRHALTVGKRTLNKYYALSNDSDLYRIAMVLHPWYKLEYFRKAGWVQEWINVALSITREAWEREYKPTVGGTSGIYCTSLALFLLNLY
ncbi:hypothetical protein EV361DRAFT_811521 [Lentinula raphanica]|nr:hypothetical protein EV361DRAFT_811521 [Lentinula raphanica]